LFGNVSGALNINQMNVSGNGFISGGTYVGYIGVIQNTTLISNITINVVFNSNATDAHFFALFYVCNFSFVNGNVNFSNANTSGAVGFMGFSNTICTFVVQNWVVNTSLFFLRNKSQYFALYGTLWNGSTTTITN